jgi:UDP-N-acetylmuramate--alanine ligase
MPLLTLTDAFAAEAVYMVGIKGSGMSALTELLVEKGVAVSGSDTAEPFYTDEVLKRLGVKYHENFDANRINSNIDVVVHSAAYPRDTHPELLRAQELGIPVLSYPEALGELSLGCDATGISGMHGKSTTTAMFGTLLQRAELPASVLAGTAVPTFDNRSTVSQGYEFFIAETCEYRRHFLSFHPDRIVITNIELEHTDYFTSLEDVRNAFVEYAGRLPSDGTIIYCADDDGATSVASHIERTKRGITCVPYGTKAEGPFRVSGIAEGEGCIRFRMDLIPEELELRVPGEHNVLNAAASVALLHSLVEKKTGSFGPVEAQACATGIRAFRGSRRRSQIVGERDGILFVDDYGHHPTEIKATLTGYKGFYPGRRIVLDFMPHLYSRTSDFFNDFISAFDDADILLMHKIYSSARETEGKVSGSDLYDAVRAHRANVHYFREVMDARDFCRFLLRPGDVFITMGAGDNWRLGAALAAQD